MKEVYPVYDGAMYWPRQGKWLHRVTMSDGHTWEYWDTSQEGYSFETLKYVYEKTKDKE